MSSAPDTKTNTQTKNHVFKTQTFQNSGVGEIMKDIKDKINGINS